MKRALARIALAVVMGLTLTAAQCATTSEPISERQQTFNNINNACNSYAAALRVASVANTAGMLTLEQVTTVSIVKTIVEPVCLGPVPNDPMAYGVALMRIKGSIYELILITQSYTIVEGG